MSSDTIEYLRASVAKPRRAIRGLGSLALVLCSTLAGLMLLETGLRLLEGPPALLDWRNLVLVSRIEERKEANSGAFYRHDPVLGYVNAPGWASPAINYDSQGFRRTPMLSAGAVPAPPILATGDSYTKGDEVADFAAWPAWLQEMLGWRTINAGVSAYGLDQTVLRSEQLVRQLRPAVLVVGFIADDVRRIEMMRLWGREKPFFEQFGDELVLRNVPVPPPPDPRDTLSPLQSAFGWSVLLDTVLDRLRLRNEWHMDIARALPAGAGERMACPLMRRVAALGVPTLVVAQYLPTAWDDAHTAAEEHRVARVVLACAAEAGLATLDLYPLFAEQVAEGGRKAVYLQWHPNERGYRMTAEAIAAELRRRGMVP
jgi:lysophospholipase L1-like esterase